MQVPPLEHWTASALWVRELSVVLEPPDPRFCLIDLNVE